jgi:hypothetical protein
MMTPFYDGSAARQPARVMGTGDATRGPFGVTLLWARWGQWLAAHLPANGEGEEIRWDLAGVLNDPAALEPVISNWTTRR